MNQDERLYVYVYRMILSDIFNDIYPYQSQLPTLSKLCSTYDVGRNTARRALLTLQDEGYIIMQRGTSATVLFHHDDDILELKYKQALMDLSGIIKDGFETMAMIFPHIGITTLKNASAEEMKELNQRVDQLDIDYIESESELIIGLFGIYEFGFSLLKNPFLNDLVSTLIYSMYYPNSSGQFSATKRKMLKHIQKSIKVLIKMSQGNQSFIAKNMIAGLCRGYGKLTEKYLKEECEGFTCQQKINFIWNVQHEEDYLYMKVVFGIIQDINHQVYKKNQLLPSIAQISELYDVSARTSRRALKALRDYKVIKTQNGVGSKIIIKNFSNKKLLSHPEIKENIKKYYYSAQLLMLLNQTVIPEIMNKCTKGELKEFVQKIRAQDYFSLTDLYKFIYKRTNQCLLTIYQELEKYRLWGIFVSISTDLSADDLSAKKPLLLTAIENKDISKVCEIVQELSLFSIKTIELS